jgi:signal transduction histidine kinase
MNVALIDHTNLLPAMLEKLLADSTIEITSFSSTDSALESLKVTHFDCICASMDIGNNGDGIFIAQELRRSSSNEHTPLLLLTDENLEKLYVKALAAGITEVFFRHDLEELVNFLTRVNDQQKPIEGKVLYIEDTKSQQQYVTALFEKNGLEVDAYTKAEEAWVAYHKNDYDLVVTDIILEGTMTGMVLTNWIRRLGEQKGDVPILAVTGYDDVARRVELFHLGVSDYVIKPIIEEELMARVRQLIRGHKYFLESKNQRKKAEQTSEAKSTFIAHMNHEFRVPLNSVMGFTELLLTDQKNPLTEEQQENLVEIQSASKVLGDLINDVTNLSKIEAGIIELNIEPVYINSAIEQSCHHLASFAAKHKVEFLPFNIPNNVAVEADPVRLNQVMINLLSNAIKYNTQNGTVQIVFKSSNDGFIRIGIKDTGIGMSQEEIKSLFKPFQRFDNVGHIEGTGLGLVITKNLVELMSGRMGCRANPDQGVTFWIDLPKATPA